MRREEAEKVARLAQHDGWRVLEAAVSTWIESLKERLAGHDPNDAAGLARIQGEITGYRRVLAYVNNRRKE